MQLTAEYLRTILDYDPGTGVFRWKACARHGFIGRVAGHIDRKGRNRIKIGVKLYLAARLAWLYVHGTFPANFIDHKDNNPGHDWIDNLRPATPTQNNANCRVHRTNKSGFKGVFRLRKKWTARIRSVGKVVRLGVFDTPEAAHKAYCEAAKKIHGEFARAA